MSKDNSLQMRAFPRFQLLIAAVAGAACLSALIVTYVKQPLFPFQLENKEWLQSWLVMTCVDYYGAVFPLSLIILASEDSLVVGFAWVVVICLLGSPFACAYAFSRLWTQGTLQLVRVESIRKD